MRLFTIPFHVLLAVTGSTYLAALLVLVVTRAPLGSTVFLGVAAVATAAYVAVVARVWKGPPTSRRLLMAAFGLAVLFRLPLAFGPVGPDSDMVRYLWDGRVQRLGYNPYALVPADPSLAHTHAHGSAAMPSRRHRTPYPPAAQLFFRLVVSISDSTLAMKLALVGCDLLTLVVIWRWLLETGRSEWLALAYAWHPLVLLEVAHSGHIDALSTLWIAAAVFWLARRRTALASVAFVLAVATKLLPIVLAPLFVGRIRPRDVLLGAALLALLYSPFASDSTVALGSVPNVVANIRFNGPLYQAVAGAAAPQVAAGLAVLLGLAAALGARLKLSVHDPAAWAWPTALALVAAPVIYPWYLLPLTPFLFSRSTLPLAAWTFSIMPVYLVWRFAREGGRWLVPAPVLLLEYGLVLAACVVVVRSALRRGRGEEPQRSR